MRFDFSRLFFIEIEQEIEIWKDVIGYEKFYQISSFGRFKYKERVVSKNKRGQRVIKERITFGVKCGVNLRNKGCFVISLTGHDSKEISYPIHRLVALNFLQIDELRNNVNHIDGNRYNNKLSNLEWVTQMENQHHCQFGKDFKSRHHGICFVKYNNRWSARISINGKRKHIGVFDTEKEAFEARKKFEIENGIIDKYRVE